VGIAAGELERVTVNKDFGASYLFGKEKSTFDGGASNTLSGSSFMISLYLFTPQGISKF